MVMRERARNTSDDLSFEVGRDEDERWGGAEKARPEPPSLG